MDGVALCARFSIATNRLAYCGPADAEPALYRAIVTGESSPAARSALSRFEALMPYLEAIGAANGKDPFDHDVVEAYWIGNALLDAVDRARFGTLLAALAGRGLPSAVARRLTERLPPHPIPHHAFHVAYVGVGAVTGHVPTTVPNVEACRPAWARVLARRDRELDLVGPAVRDDGGRLVVDGEHRRTLPYDPAVLGTVREGETVAVHWAWPALALRAEEAQAVERWTRRSFDLAGAALAGGAT